MRSLRERIGSATTEGVVVALFLAMLFGATIWVARLFVGSLALGREVRAQIDGPSFRGGADGVEDTERTAHFGPALGLADRWVPVRSRELATIKIDRVEGSRSTSVERPRPVGGGSVQLRWEDSRQRNEVPRAGPDGNWPALSDTWCRTGMCSL